mgnify:CR=1 FL=1|tara:strand:+ start:675 stop:1565 length:891 start_codon:yes stop_codon:yes gene_type:complete
MNQREKTVFESSGLNYTVSKRKFHLPSIGETNYYAIVNDTTEQVISTCKERYKVMQNTEVMEVIKNIFPNSELTTCGHFDNGGKTFHFLKSTKESMYLGSEEVNFFYYVLNSHDGSSGLRFGIASMVVSCSNIFSTLPGDSLFCLKHTTNLEENASVKAQIISSLDEVMESQKHTFHDWFCTRMSTEDVHSMQSEVIIKKAMGIDHRIPTNKLSAKQTVRFNEIKQCCIDEMRNKGYNLFGYYNGFTYYCTNTLGERSTKNNVSPYKTVLKGVGNEIATRAFKAVNILYESRQQPS